MTMMTVEELPERLRALHRPGDPLPTWNDPHIVNTWGWPHYRREHFERYIRGEYLGAIDEVPDGTPSLAPLEAFDHPNLKRILTWEGFQGHPLRRDYLEPPLPYKWPHGG